jgi:hypothetical protein
LDEERKCRAKVTLRVLGSNGGVITSLPLASAATGWHELPFSFTNPVRDTQAAIEIVASGHGSLLIDFVSLMRSDVRHNGMFRPDLLDALRGLQPSFIRWPGGSFASTYKWKEAIGHYAPAATTLMFSGATTLAMPALARMNSWASASASTANLSSSSRLPLPTSTISTTR